MFTSSHFFSALACWGMAIMMFRAWWFPQSGDVRGWVQYGVGIMVMEFFVIHSGGFVGFLHTPFSSFLPTGIRTFSLLGLIGFYSLMAFVVATVFRNPALLIGFVVLLGTRLLVARRWIQGEEAGLLMGRSMMSIVPYLGAVFLTTLAPIPSGGLPASVAGAGSGLWEAEPYRALAAGVVYFSLLGCMEWTGYRWLLPIIPR